MTQETEEAFDKAYEQEQSDNVDDAELEAEEQSKARPLQVMPKKPEMKRGRPSLVPKQQVSQTQAKSVPVQPKSKPEIKQRYEVGTRSAFVGIIDNLAGETIDMQSPESLSYVLAKILNQLEGISIATGAA